MNAIIRGICLVVFFTISTIAFAGEAVFAVKFSIQESNDGRICGAMQIDIKKKNPGFFPVMILQHQVVEKLPGGNIRRVGVKIEENTPVPLQKGVFRYCFDHLERNQYQVSSWYVLYAGKIYTIMFDDGAGGASNELLWDAKGEKVPEDIIREEDIQRETAPSPEPSRQQSNRKMLSSK